MAPMDSGRTLPEREREIVALTYVLSIIPLFGILIASIIILTYQERSRTVVFHAKQAIGWQACFLVGFIFICLFGLFAFLVGVLSPRLGALFVAFDRYILYLVFIAYVLSGFYFGWKSLEGHDLEIPMVGAWLRGRSE